MAIIFNFPLISFSQSDESQIKSVITQLFDGMRTSDTSKINSCFEKDARLQTILFKEGNPSLVTDHVNDLTEAVAIPHTEIWDERIISWDIRINGLLASCWAEYEFYIGKKFSHCGVDAFQLYKREGKWKIIQLSDTRRTDCVSDSVKVAIEKQKIDSLLNNWHRAAATADETIFFGSMTQGSIYLGTDKTENWTKEEFEKWAQKHFEKETAWNFKPYDRHIYFSSDRKTAWFDELLDTWMGICRGSGVVELTSDGWKIKHYNLAVTIDNDLVKEFIKLIRKK
ncbi:MAG: nuclear transport factor 2 family protein [Bacteroidota bacterium]